MVNSILNTKTTKKGTKDTISECMNTISNDHLPQCNSINTISNDHLPERKCMNTIYNAPLHLDKCMRLISATIRPPIKHHQQKSWRNTYIYVSCNQREGDCASMHKYLIFILLLFLNQLVSAQNKLGNIWLFSNLIFIKVIISLRQDY